MVRAAGGILSVKTPFVRQQHAYDVQIEHRSGTELEIWITPGLVQLLAETLRAKCSSPEPVGKFTMMKVNAGPEASLTPGARIPSGDKRAIIQETAAYHLYMADIERVCRRLFPTVQFFQSDLQAGLDGGTLGVEVAA